MKPHHIYFSLERRPYKFALQFTDAPGKKKIIEAYSFPSYHLLIKNLIETLWKFDQFTLEKTEYKYISEWQSNSARKNLPFAKDRSHLFIQSPDLTEKHSDVSCNYWFRTNLDQRAVNKLCRSLASSISLKIGKWGEFNI